MAQKSQPVIAIPEKDGFGVLVPLFCSECGRKLEIALGSVFQHRGKYTRSINLYCPRYGKFWAAGNHTYFKQAGWAEERLTTKYSPQTGERIS